jgi:hypothetical protein
MDYPGKVITKNQVTPTQTSATGVWTLDDAAAATRNNNWPVALVPNPISKSLRFNSADSAYLNRTPASAGNRRTFTWSGWVKRGALAVQQYVFSPRNTATNGIAFLNTDVISIEVQGNAIYTSAVYRDPSAWYHIVLAVDTTQATSSDRVKLYVNGVQVTAFSSAAYPTQNTDTDWNNTVAHNIGRQASLANSYYSGYLTEINFVDGQALTPSDFGLTNPQTGQWIPKKYTGTYGTNGFYLNFKDATSTTTLGYDYSGNANNWTTNNFSVTAGSGNDSLTDVPTPWVAYNTTGDVGGVVRGNYCTLNPLNKNTSGTLSNGNLEWQASTTAVQVVTGTSTIIPSGKTYFEVNVVTAAGASNYYQLGIVPFGKSLTTDIGVSSGNGYAIEQNGNSDIRLRLNGTSVTVSTVVQTGDVLQVAVDYATGKLWFGRNNTWYNSSGGTTGNPTAGTNETATISTTTDWFPAVAKYNTGGSYAINFGQRPFAYTPPAGFLSLCTTNLPATTIGFGLTNQADDYFTAYLYTADGTSPKSRTGIGFAPDFLWFKDRTSSFSHALYDTVRGTNKGLQTNTTAAENTYTLLTAFGSDGFTTSDDGTVGNLLNYSTDNYVTWAWKAAGSTVSNTAGTITSTVSANTTAGFSIVTYTGNGTNGATVGHGLGIAPSLIFIKNRGAVASWLVYSSSIGASNFLVLNTTDASAASALPFNNTAPTSSVFSLGTSGGTNTNGGTFVAYCFAAVPGYSAFGSYTGNNSADGPFIYLGFRPAFVLIKTTNTTQWWTLLDNKRDTYNVATLGLSPNSSDSETTFNTNRGPHNMDFVSNGLKIRTDNSAVNGTNTFIYAAFAEYPFQFANAR